MAEQCTATARSTSARCAQPQMPGSTVCRFHGGAAPQVRARAAQRVVEQEARRMFGRLVDHAAPVAEPLVELQKLAGEVVAWKQFCAGRIEQLEELSSHDEKGAEQIDAEVALFERALDRCVATLVQIAKLGIEDRMAKVSERQAAAVVRAIDAALDVAGVSGELAEDARAVGARELRSVS